MILFLLSDKKNTKQLKTDLNLDTGKKSTRGRKGRGKQRGEAKITITVLFDGD